VDDLADAALSAWSAGSRRSPRPTPIQLQFPQRGHGLDLPIGSLPPRWHEAWARRARPLGTRKASPMAPRKNNSTVSKLGGPRLENPDAHWCTHMEPRARGPQST